MYEYESELLDDAAEIVRTCGSGPDGFSRGELLIVVDALVMIRTSIKRVISGGSCTIHDWGFCLYLADSSYTDEEFSKIDQTGEVWKRHVANVHEKCYAFLPRLKLKKRMTDKERQRLADAIEEASRAHSDEYYAAEDDDL